ncbi:hypothetical protein [Pseudomonas laurylsulfatiphila]|uniref:hypothetical protein n=1 Tax=Pseudomonas laurylsulfatiphila TaxID=2011015 RepID=UPI003D1F709F|nr:hypothetical protein [Pseudomonas reinekei]MDF9902846.1 hypothetical protein [Pseudomonas reinekei]
MHINYPALSMKSDAYFIKNPLEVTNSYTKTNADDAVDVLKLNDKLSLQALKDSLKGYDFTSVSTYELAMVGSLLRESGLIDKYVSIIFTSGSMATDENGHQAGAHVKFNAIAMLNQMLEDRLSHGTTEAAGFHEFTKGLIRANHVLGALSYFANSVQSDLSVSIQA